MATIIIKNSTGSGVVPSSLIQGELAINVVDGRLFYGSGSGNAVKEFRAETGSFATTGSNIFVGNQIISGNVTVTGTASINTLVVNQTQYSSGSNQLGDAANDTQTLFGSVIIPTGSLTVTGSVNVSGSSSISGPLTVSFGNIVGGTALYANGNTIHNSGRGIYTTGYAYGIQGNQTMVGNWSSQPDAAGVHGTGQIGVYGSGSIAGFSGPSAFFTTLTGTNRQGARLASSLVQVRGSGATSATTALLVENTNGSASLAILDDRSAIFYNGLIITGSATVTSSVLTPTVFSDFLVSRNSILGNNNVRSIKPLSIGASANSLISNTGSIRIVTPGRGNSHMIKYIFDVYSYAGVETTVETWGYDNGGWAGTRAKSTNPDIIVRFGYDTTGKAVIYLGSYTQNWGAYAPSIVVREVELLGWQGNITTSASLYYDSANYQFSMASSSGTDIISDTITNTGYNVLSAYTASFINTASTNAFVQGGNSFGATALLGTNDSQSLAFETSGSVRMFISSSGNVGVGTITPAYGITHVGTIGTAGIFSQRDFGAGAFAQITQRSSFIGYTTDGTSGIAIGATSGTARIQGFLNLPATTSTLLSLQPLGGNVSIGAITNSARLQVRGSGTTSATTTLQVENNNTSASLVVLDNGLVGIGITTPTASLHISASDSSSAYSFLVQNSLGQVLFSSQNDRTVNINSTNAANGNTTIGTTNGTITFNQGYNNILAGNALTFYNGGAASTIQGWFTNPGIAIGYTQTTTQPNPGTALAIRGTVATSGSGVLFVTGSSTTRLLTIASETSSSILVVSGSGNIGVGTNNPSANIHIVNSSSAAFRLQNVGGSSADFSISAGNSRFELVGNGASSGRITILQGAKYVGINQQTPTAAFHIVGAGATSATTAFLVQNSTPTTLFQIQDHGSSSFSGNLTVTGSTLIGNITAPALNDTIRVTANIGVTTVYSVATGSYDGAFFDYVIRSGSNARAGQIMGLWSGSNVNFTETTTTDFGNTSNFIFGMSILAGNMILSGSTTSNGWTVKTIVRSI